MYITSLTPLGSPINHLPLLIYQALILYLPFFSYIFYTIENFKLCNAMSSIESEADDLFESSDCETDAMNINDVDSDIDGNDSLYVE